MKPFIFLAVMSISIQLQGQDLRQLEDKQVNLTVPDHPTMVKDELDGASPPSLRSLAGRPPALEFQIQPREKTPRRVNRSFVLFTLLQFGAAIGDVESTQYGLSHGLQEANPLVGSHPSRAKLYGISMSVGAGLALWSYNLKKAAPHSRAWMIPPSVSYGMHTSAAIYNLVKARN